MLATRAGSRKDSIWGGGGGGSSHHMGRCGPPTLFDTSVSHVPKACTCLTERILEVDRTQKEVAATGTHLRMSGSPGTL